LKLFIEAQASISVPSTGGEKLRRYGPVKQAVAVLGKHRRVPNSIVDAQSHEPAKQQVSVEPLHQLPLGAHGIKGLQQHCPQQPFRRDRRPTRPGIKRGEIQRQCRKGCIGDLTDHPQRMVAPNPRLQINIAEKPS
jgi:hypothetical protein